MGCEGGRKQRKSCKKHSLAQPHAGTTPQIEREAAQSDDRAGDFPPRSAGRGCTRRFTSSVRVKPAGWRQLLPPAHPVPSPRLFFFFPPFYTAGATSTCCRDPARPQNQAPGAVRTPETPHKIQARRKTERWGSTGCSGGAAPQFHYLQQGNLLRLGRNPKWHLSPPNRYLSLSINPLSITISLPAPRARAGRSPRGGFQGTAAPRRGEPSSGGAPNPRRPPNNRAQPAPGSPVMGSHHPRHPK